VVRINPTGFGFLLIDDNPHDRSCWPESCVRGSPLTIDRSVIQSEFERARPMQASTPLWSITKSIGQRVGRAEGVKRARPHVP